MGFFGILGHIWRFLNSSNFLNDPLFQTQELEKSYKDISGAKRLRLCLCEENTGKQL